MMTVDHVTARDGVAGLELLGPYWVNGSRRHMYRWGSSSAV